MADTSTSAFDPKDYEKLATGSQVDAVTNNFDESKGVAGRVASLTTQPNPLLETARTRAAQAANARGLRNSSMAVQSGEQAVIETATPIATADAQLFQNQQLANQTARNQTNQFNSTARTQVGLQGLQAGQQENQFGRSLMEQARQYDTTAGLEGRKLDLNASQFTQNLDLQKQQLAQQKEQFAAQLGLDSKQLDLQRDQLTQQQQQFLKDLEFKQTQLDQQSKMNDAQLLNQRVIAQMDADNRVKLADIEAGYKADIAANENIANAWGTMMQNINAIQTNPDLTEDAKKVSIQNQIASFQSFTNFWKQTGAGTLDVSSLLNFGVTSNAPAPGQSPAPAPGAAPAPAPAPGVPPDNGYGGFMDMVRRAKPPESSSMPPVLGA